MFKIASKIKALAHVFNSIVTVRSIPRLSSEDSDSVETGQEQS